jgi:hypothetical protein
MQIAVKEKHFKDNLWFFNKFYDTHMDKAKLNEWIILRFKYQNIWMNAKTHEMKNWAFF